MRLLLAVLIIAATACAARTPAAQPPQPPPQPTAEPTPTAPAIVDGPLTGDVLIRVVSEQFPEAVAAGTVVLNFGTAGVENDLLAELAKMDIRTIVEFHAIIPADFKTRGIAAIEASGSPTTVAGLIRDFLIIHDVRGYFTKAWNDGWVASGPADFPAPAAYGVDFAVMTELGVFGGGEPDPYDDSEDW